MNSHSVRRADERAREYEVRTTMFNVHVWTRTTEAQAKALARSFGDCRIVERVQVTPEVMPPVSENHAAHAYAKHLLATLPPSPYDVLRCARCDREHDGSWIDNKGVSSHCSEGCYLMDRDEAHAR